jgi:hypothetical protein
MNTKKYKKYFEQNTQFKVGDLFLIPLQPGTSATPAIVKLVKDNSNESWVEFLADHIDPKTGKVYDGGEGEVYRLNDIIRDIEKGNLIKLS